MPEIGSEEEQKQRLIYRLMSNVSNATLNGRRRIEVSVDDALRIAMILLREKE